MVSVSRVTAPLRGQHPAVDGHGGRDGDAGQRHDGAPEGGSGAERGGAADLPEHVAGLGAVDQVDQAARPPWSAPNRPGRRTPRRGRRPVQREGAGEPDRRGRVVDAGGQRPPAEVSSDGVRRALAGCVAVGGDQIGLGLLRHGVPGMVDPVIVIDAEPVIEVVGKGADVTLHGGRSGVVIPEPASTAKLVAVPNGPWWRQHRRSGRTTPACPGQERRDRRATPNAKRTSLGPFKGHSATWPGSDPRTRRRQQLPGPTVHLRPETSNQFLVFVFDIGLR